MDHPIYINEVVSLYVCLVVKTTEQNGVGFVHRDDFQYILIKQKHILVSICRSISITESHKVTPLQFVDRFYLLIQYNLRKTVHLIKIWCHTQESSLYSKQLSDVHVYLYQAVKEQKWLLSIPKWSQTVSLCFLSFKKRVRNLVFKGFYLIGVEDV